VHLVTSFTPSFSTVDALFGFTNRAIWLLPHDVW